MSIVGILFKAALFYFLFLFLRGLYRGYKVLKILKKPPPKSSKDTDVFEAEYRHLDD